VASGFGDTTIEKISKARTQTVADRFAPVEILIKPKPAYPEEAREKKIEGEVLIEMEFSASGEAHVLRLVRGLGYGLDESALAAARGIRFRPATRDGLLVDSAAVVHILFQLAQ
jgi:TonB family protein